LHRLHFRSAGDREEGAFKAQGSNRDTPEQTHTRGEAKELHKGRTAAGSPCGAMGLSRWGSRRLVLLFLGAALLAAQQGEAG
jgi:hypothetical protein